MPFPGELARNETKTSLSWIWTRVANFVSYDDNRYTKRSGYPYIFTLSHKRIKINA